MRRLVLAWRNGHAWSAPPVVKPLGCSGSRFSGVWISGPRSVKVLGLGKTARGSLARRWGKQTGVGPDGRPPVVKLDSPRRAQDHLPHQPPGQRRRPLGQRIQDHKDRFPYLMYDAVNDSRTRPQHLEWDGLVLPVDHSFWKTHRPAQWMGLPLHPAPVPLA